MRVHDLVLPKIDESQQNCEDRLAFVTDEASGSMRAAVADGASATAFSGQWAELLVSAFCERPFTGWDDLAFRAEAAAKQWAADVYSQDRPWHALMRAQSGGAAAIAGVEIFERERKWSAIALGDSCVFHVRGERISTAIPPYSPDQFDNHPRLISTDASKNVGLASAFETASGCYEVGDRFVLATDAASEAFLKADQTKDGLRDWLRALAWSKNVAKNFVNLLRASRDLRDDDIAIVLIEV